MTGHSLVAQARTDQRVYLAVSLAVLLATLLPFLCVDFVPLLDYPNHLARAYVLEHIDDVPAFATMYESAWSVIPNLGSDALFALLLPLSDIQSASTLFFALLVGVTHLGAHVLGRELHGRATWLAPLSAFFVFSYALFLGFVNYVLAVAVFYWAFAAWLRLWRGGSGLALAVTTLLVVLGYLTHLSAYGFFLVAIAAWALLHRREVPRTRWIVALLPALVPAALHLLFATGLGEGGVAWDGPLMKLRVAGYFLRTYDLALDVAFVGVFFAAIFLAVRWSGDARDRRRLAAGVALLVCFVVAPTQWHGTWALDQRFLLPGVVLLLLAFDADVRLPRVRWAYGVAVAVLVARSLAVLAVWLPLDGRIGAYVDFMQHIRPGARVFSTAFGDFDGDHYQRSFAQMPHYAAIFRHATVRRMFAIVGQQPLRALPAAAASIAVSPSLSAAPAAVSWPAIFASYDALWLWRAPDAYRAWLDARCLTRAAWDEVVLYQDCAATRPAP